jgi:uncharacterized membrane protein YedE/YeeE
MHQLIPVICGLLFGAGLAMSGMTDTARVLGFLDIAGEWDPSLVFVMAGAVTTAAIGFHLVQRRQRPFYGTEFHLPQKTALDKPLVIGAAIFGVGWGLYGYCPGPAVAALVYGDLKTLVFLLAMLIGMAAAYSRSRWVPNFG